MKLYYLSNSVIPSQSANAVQVMRMCEALARAGHDVTLFCRLGDSGDDPYAFYGVSRCFELSICRRLPIGPLGALGYAADIGRRVRQRGLPDLFYARHAVALASVARLGKPLMLEAHMLPEPWTGLVERWLFCRPNFARLVTISEALRTAYLAAISRLTPERVVVARDAAEPLDYLRVVPVSLASSEGTSRLRVGYVGHLYAGRGIEVILQLARRCPEIDFHIVGGTKKALEYWQRLGREQSNLVFHGHVPAAVTASYMRAMDVVLAPYQTRVTIASGTGDTVRWMSPLKIFEYMAAGKAVIASDLPVIGEILRDGEDALLVPPHALEAWEQALRRLRDDTVLRHDLGTAARKKLEAHFTWNRRAQLVLEGFG